MATVWVMVKYGRRLAVHVVITWHSL